MARKIVPGPRALHILYIKRNWSHEKIADFYSTTVAVVKYRLHKHGIRKRRQVTEEDLARSFGL